MADIWQHRAPWAPTPSFSGIAAKHEVYRAWQDVRGTRGKTVGVDGVDKKAFRANLKHNIEDISQALTDGVYAPQPALGCPISKPNGDVRWLGIPTIRDRVVSRAMHREFTRTLDDQLASDSYAYRCLRGQQEALRALAILTRRYRYCLVFDVQSYFDEISHDLLLARLQPVVPDGSVMVLVQRFLQSGIIKNGSLENPAKGLMQGAPLSPFLANLFLAPLVRALRLVSDGVVHYGDDIAVFSDEPDHLGQVQARVVATLTDWFKLNVNIGKSGTADLHQHDVSMLGYWFNSTSAIPHEENEAEIVSAVTGVRGRKRKREGLRGYVNAFAFGDVEEFWKSVYDRWPDDCHRQLHRQAMRQAAERKVCPRRLRWEKVRRQTLIGRLRWHPRMSITEAFGESGPLKPAIAAGAA